ncbi:helix-turn-helix transcriptional regulator [Clostridium gasigenes]|uniref:helix-turn-helix transcriptional regulator n=1 Tax=Clostridium gasigenes TaxID=94869 RepID=UPI0014383681|nr:helix-turn-helix transcriptional regulator [Clostridium gasigenes]NKF05651.1 helix-turn-helix transcriptional regulator [Clostridium gasigenes]QSW19089.1 helix-turn-helix transcriptional regulator [Clostridium gasigenes]
MKNSLESLRKELGLSQEQFGKLMGVSRQTIISIEKGKYNPSLELAFKISEFFSKKIEDIFFYKEGQ